MANGGTNLSRNDLKIVIVSRRSIGDLGLEWLRAAAIASPERAGKDGGRPDVYLVDVGGGPQLPLVTQLAQGGSQALVVFGGAGGLDTVRYLDAGAADYIPQGAAPDELAARLRAAGRRRGARVRPEADAIVIGELSISVVLHEVRRAGELVPLTPHEFELLETLLSAPGEVVPHRKLMMGIWGVANRANRQSLGIYIRQLRKKLEAKPEAPALIVTERGRGYRLRTDAAQPAE